MNPRFRTPDEQARVALARIESQGRAVWLDAGGQIHVAPRKGIDAETIQLLKGAREAAAAILRARQHHQGWTYQEWRRRLPLASFVNPEIARAYGAYHVPDEEIA